MPKALKQLLAEHRRLGHMMHMLEAQIRCAIHGDAIDAHLVRRIATLCCAYMADFHHPVEETLFSRLVLRRPDLLPKVKWMLQQHEDLAQQCDDLLVSANTLLAGGAIPAQEITERLCEFVIHNVQHRDIEEKTLFPIAAGYLTAADWRIVERVAHAERRWLAGSGASQRLRRNYRSLLAEPVS